MALTRPKYSNIVDSDYKNSCRVVTTTNITLSGSAPDTYDTVTLVNGDRVLVVGQDTASQNGIYTVLSAGTGSNGTWTRSFDANDGSRLTSGTQVAVSEGSNAGKIYRLVTPDPIVINTTPLTWVFPGGNPGGTNTQIQFNSNGSLAGASSFTFDNATGNVTVGRLRSTSGLFWSGNNTAITTGITYTAGTSSPAGARAGDQWYNTESNVLYQLVNDGTSTYWVDIQTQTLAANTIACLPLTGGTITGNLAVTQSGLFRGPYDESSTLSGVFVGNTGAGVPSPRIGFFTGNTQQNWQIDNFGGAFRWFVPGSSKMTLYDTGILNVSGGYTIGGKKAVNGPAFRAYISTGQTIASAGAQVKVTFGGETFDTDNCFASSTFTPTVEGYYQLNATVRIAGTAGTGENMLVLYKNGGEYARGTNGSGTEIGANFYSMQVSDIVYANGTGDYFEVYIQQGSGSNRDTTAGTNISYFSGCMIRGA
jgi:hypothetical protein